LKELGDKASEGETWVGGATGLSGTLHKGRTSVRENLGDSGKNIVYLAKIFVF